MSSMTDALDVLPGLRDYAGRFEQDARVAQVRLQANCKLRSKLDALRAEAVELLDAVLGIAAVLAHVPFADPTRGTRHGIRMAHDASDEIAALEATPRRRLLHFAEQLVSEHEPFATGRRYAVFT